jgi:hypothetical protein
MSNRYVLFPAIVLAGSFLLSSPVSAQELDDEEERTLVHPDDNAAFPLFVVGGNLTGFTRQDSGGSLLSADLQVDADWFLGGARVAGGLLANSENGVVFSEFSGYAHLLAIGISDITYRHYINGHDLRVFGGFSYTNHVEDVVRVDVNLGLGYFNESLLGNNMDQVGFQLGTRVLAQFWQIRNTFYISAYQMVRFNDATVDLSGTEIVCDTSGVLAGEDLVCTVPERDGEDGGGGSILDWQTTGVILHNRTFLWLHRDGETVWGPEIEFRLEILPLRGTNIWAMAGFRGQWETN